MNKQEFRKKNKKHFHYKAPDCDVINEANNDFDHSSECCTSGYGIKALEENRELIMVLLSAIIFSAILAIAISISGAK